MLRFLTLLVFSGVLFGRQSLIPGWHQEGSLVAPMQVEAWTFSATKGDALFLSIGKTSDTNGRFWPYIVLLDPANIQIGASLGPVVSQVRVAAPADGVYTVLVSSNSGQGSFNRDGMGTYRLYLAKTAGGLFQPDGDEGGVLRNGVRHQGSITVGDVDTWTFHSAGGEAVFLSIADTDNNDLFWPFISLIGPDGATVASSLGNAVARIVVTTPATRSGTYTVFVSSNSGQGSGNLHATGRYALKLAKAPGVAGAALQADENNLGSLTLGNIDIWSLQAAAGDTIRLRVDDLSNSAVFWPWMTLHAPNGATVRSSLGDVTAEFTATAPVSGTYTVLVSSNSGQGSGNPHGTGPYRVTSSHVGYVCSDRDIQSTFSPSDITYHRYPAVGGILTRICDKADPRCSRQSVFSAMLSNAKFVAPTDDTALVFDCKITFVNILFLPNNPIRTVVDPDYSLTNYTLPGHFLHPGKVVRTVVEDETSVSVETWGEGSGWLGKPNEVIAPWIWSEVVDAGLKDAVSRRLATPLPFSRWAPTHQ